MENQEAKNNKMNQYKYVSIPSDEFKNRIVNEDGLRQKLKNTLNYYSRCKKVPDIMIKKFLESTMDNRVFIYTFLSLVLLGGISMVFLPGYFKLIPLFICTIMMVLAGVLFVWFYENAYDYKAMKTLISRFSMADIKKFSMDFNNEEERKTK